MAGEGGDGALFLETALGDGPSNAPGQGLKRRGASASSTLKPWSPKPTGIDASDITRVPSAVSGRSVNVLLLAPIRVNDAAVLCHNHFRSGFIEMRTDIHDVQHTGTATAVSNFVERK